MKSGRALYCSSCTVGASHIPRFFARVALPMLLTICSRMHIYYSSIGPRNNPSKQPTHRDSYHNFQEVQPNGHDPNTWPDLWQEELRGAKGPVMDSIAAKLHQVEAMLESSTLCKAHHILEQDDAWPMDKKIL